MKSTLELFKIHSNTLKSFSILHWRQLTNAPILVLTTTTQTPLEIIDKGYTISFGATMCVITNLIDNSIIFIRNRHRNVYIIDLNNISNLSQCLIANEVKNNKISWLWHRRLGHASMDLMSKLVKKNLVKGLPKVNYERNKVCDACQLGKQTRNTFKPKNIVSATRPLELLHMDLFGPTRTISLGGKRYGLVIVDDYSRFTWVIFLAHKDETFGLF